jgi:hypothetical protein
MEGERGSASVEHAALVLLAALVAAAVVALVAIGPERKDGALASAITPRMFRSIISNAASARLGWM